MIECDFCGAPFEPERTRWLCPSCKQKCSCCEGSPLAEEPVDFPKVAQKMVTDE
jgi:hypothetical protein